MHSSTVAYDNCCLRCYMKVDDSPFVSWEEGRDKCSKQGQSLANLRTVDEWDSLLSAFKRGYENNGCFYIGLQRFDKFAAYLYRNMWHWLDGTVALYVNISGAVRYTVATIGLDSVLNPRFKHLRVCNGYICEWPVPAGKTVSPSNTHPPLLRSTDSNSLKLNLSLVQCPEGHVTRDFLSCDPQSQCVRHHPVSTCPLHSGENRMSINFPEYPPDVPSQDGPTTPTSVPMFECGKAGHSIPYSLVCDFKEECRDLSDERFCHHIPCPEKRCESGQCILQKDQCDGVSHCYDSSDELQVDLSQALSK